MLDTFNIVFMNYEIPVTLLPNIIIKMRSDLFVCNYVIQSVLQFDTKSRETDSIS